jgi:hypothetical protein
MGRLPLLAKNGNAVGRREVGIKKPCENRESSLPFSANSGSRFEGVTGAEKLGAARRVEKSYKGRPKNGPSLRPMACIGETGRASRAISTVGEKRRR